MISSELIDAYIAFFPGTERDAAEGSIAMWMNGQGELNADLIASSPIWEPVAHSFAAANTAAPLTGEAPAPSTNE